MNSYYPGMTKGDSLLAESTGTYDTDIIADIVLRDKFYHTRRYGLFCFDIDTRYCMCQYHMLVNYQAPGYQVPGTRYQVWI